MSACSNTPSDLDLIGIKLIGETGIDFTSRDGHSQESNTSFTGSITMVSVEDSNASSRYSVSGLKTTGDVLGFVALPTASAVTLAEFRRRMGEQVTILPDNYLFLSREGWPVSTPQEESLTIKYVITSARLVLIRRQYSKPRFGVHLNTGAAVGFIFCDLTAKALTIRDVIAEELSPFLANVAFVLLDKNGWPVTLKQESILSAWDLMNNGTFTIRPLKRSRHPSMDTTDGIGIKMEKSPSDPDEDTVGPGTDAEDLPTDNDNSHSTPVRQPLRKSSSQEILNRYSVDIPPSEVGSIPNIASALVSRGHTDSIYSTPSISTTINGSTILISYVRNEAEQHARQLKSQLNDIGCSVFLDVDEIQGGHDWQDALNNAVQNCQIFVPLITPQYGLTQWTNREVKLADMKQKLIIPVNFNESWPPECLAIQFATTQYLSWKDATEIAEEYEKHGERANDIRYWDETYVARAAERIKTISGQARRSVSMTDSGFGSMSMRSNSLAPSIISSTVPLMGIASSVIIPTVDEIDEPRISPRKLALQNGPLRTRSSLEAENFYVIPKRDLIVISAHPDQLEFVDDVRKELTKVNFDVWCSTDMCIGSYSEPPLCTSPTQSCQSLPFIPLSPDSEFPPEGSSFNSQESTSSVEFVKRVEKENGYSQTSSKPRGRPSFKFSFSQDSENESQKYRGKCFGASQASDFGSQNSIFSPEDIDKCKVFRDRVNEARVVLVILSKSYYTSKTCKRQVMYCDYRKTLIGVNYDNERMPHWCTKRLSHHSDIIPRPCHDIIAGKVREIFVNNIVLRVQGMVGAAVEMFKSEMTEARIQSLCTRLTKRIPISDRKKIFVYITGGCRFFNQHSDPICKAIGQTLAGKDNIVLVTSGFHGAAEAVGRAFVQERGQPKIRPREENIYHLLPRQHDKKDKDFSTKARQQENGSFEPVRYGGSTEFLGDSVNERDAVAARLFNFCILVEGGPSSARVAQEFIWNDNVVIPLILTGGAAGGDFVNSEHASSSLLDMPAGVNQNDWDMLSRKDVPHDDIAQSIVHILMGLSKARTVKKCSFMGKNWRFKCNRKHSKEKGNKKAAAFSLKERTSQFYNSDR